MTAWKDPYTWPHGRLVNETRLNDIMKDLLYLKEQSDAVASSLDAQRGLFRGLVMRSHPDADKAASQVVLHRLDQAGLDTGRGVADWVTTIPLVFDFAAGNGAGGLDIGSEQASTWYQIYGIHKSSDGTKALLGHRARDFFLDEQYDADDATVEIRKATGTRTAAGQGFKVDTNGALAFIDVKLIRVGSPAGFISFELRPDDGTGKPTSTVLATSDAFFLADIVDTNALWVRFMFRTLPALTAATQYHLVATGTWTASDTAYVGWRCDTSSASYANGTRTQLEGGTWNNTGTTTHDFSFKIYVVRNDSPVTMPSGYDGKVLLGYCYNDGSSNLRPFQAWNRDVTPLTQTDIGSPAGTGTLPVLVDMSAHVPPTQVEFWFWLTGSGASSDIRIGPVPDCYFLGAGSRGQARLTHGSVTISLGRAFEAIITESQGLYVRAGAGSIDALLTATWRWL